MFCLKLAPVCYHLIMQFLLFYMQSQYADCWAYFHAWEYFKFSCRKVHVALPSVYICLSSICLCTICLLYTSIYVIKCISFSETSVIKTFGASWQQFSLHTHSSLNFLDVKMYGKHAHMRTSWIWKQGHKKYEINLFVHNVTLFTV